jgi:hypothetical protein
MTRFVFQGSGHTTGGDGWKAIAVIGAGLLLLSGGAAAAAVSDIASAVVTLLYWVVGTIYGAGFVFAVALLATRGRRAERRAELAADFACRQRAREAEIEERHARRALAQAQAQAQAWAPLIGAITAAVRQEQNPVRMVRREVER